MALTIVALVFVVFTGSALAAAVTITSPANGSTVSGMVTVNLSMVSGTSWCNVYVDGVYQNSTPPMFFYWQTSSFSNGTHTVSATAFNQSGSNLGTATSKVTVANGGAVSLTSPTNGSTVSGTVTIGVAKSSSVSWANVYVNGVYQNSTPPNSFSWNTEAIQNGTYNLSVTGFSGSGAPLGSAQSTVTVANANASGGGTNSNAVSITSPTNGSTVSGTVNIVASRGSGVSWINAYIDGNYFASSPPANFSWNSGNAANGSHTISAQAYNSSGKQMGSASTVVNVQNGVVSGTGYFSTLPPGSTLPSDSVCASEVSYNPNFEPRPDNYTANHTIPPSGDLGAMMSTTNNGGAAAGSFDRVDGNFTGTTDEILQWGACKWGFDENLVRAMAANESWWHQSGAGDFTSNLSLCPSGASYTDGGCKLSYGIMQVKSSDFSGTFPYSWNSTAFNVDYKLAYQRACFEGKIPYLSQRSSSYPNGDENNMLWGCIDQWQSGTWWSGSDDTYTTQIRQLYATKPWLSSNFLQ